MRSWFAPTATLLAVTASVTACTSAPAGQGRPIDAGADAPSDGGTTTGGGASSHGSSTTGSGTGGAPACNPEKPDVIPDGWVAWTEWSCKCPFWIPGDDASMPPPIQWEPCANQPVPGLDCQQIRVDWSVGAVDPIAVSPWFGRDPTGRPSILLSRQITGTPYPYAEHLVTDLDGTITFAMRQAGEWDDGCTPFATSNNEGRFTLHVTGDGSTEHSLDSKVDGLIYGDVGERVPRLGPLGNDNDEDWSWWIGQEWLIKGVAPALVDELYNPDFTFQQVLWTPWDDPDGLPAFTPIIVGRDIVFAVGNYSMLGIMAYDDLRGVHPLVRHYGDTTQGAFNVGTDGEHLVWTHGEDKPAGELLYPTRSIMAADYTTDPLALVPKRLRSDPSQDIGNKFVVGCGYAAHDGANAKSTIIVRIDDGVSWTLTGEQTNAWGNAIGITCEEVILLVFTPPMLTPNIARVRLDSLGPGTLPD